MWRTIKIYFHWSRAVILLALHPASLMHKNSQDRKIIDGLRPLEHNDQSRSIDLSKDVFWNMLCFHNFEYELKATPKHKSNIICSLNRLRTISVVKFLLWKISIQFTDKIFFKSSHVYLPDRCMFAIYGKRVAEPRWLTVVPSIMAKLLSNWF